MIRVRLYKTTPEDNVQELKPFKAFRTDGLGWSVVKDISNAIALTEDTDITLYFSEVTKDVHMYRVIEKDFIKANRFSPNGPLGGMVITFFDEFKEAPDLVQLRINKGDI